MDDLETSTWPSPVTTEGLFHMEQLSPSAPSTAAPVHTQVGEASPSSRGAPPNIRKSVAKQPKERRRRNKERRRRIEIRLCDNCRSIRSGLLPCQICQVLDKGCIIEAEALQPTKRHATELTHPLAFLYRARHTIATTMLRRDRPFDFSGEVRYPPKPRWGELLQEFFTGWNAAAHFVHARSVIEWKEQVCQNAGAGGVDLAFGVGNVRAATVLMSLAMGSLSGHRESKAREDELDSWIWTLNFGDKMFQTAMNLLKREAATLELAQAHLELAQAHLELAQAHLILDMYLLSTNRLVLAWHFFGATVHMMKRLGLHTGRKIDIYRTSRSYYAKIQSERRLFWSAYLLDRQISVLTRRPNRWNVDMFGPPLPQSVDYENPDKNGAVGIAPSHCYASGLIHRVSLARLFDKIRNQVYTLRDVSEDERWDDADNLFHDLKEWSRDVPLHLTKPWSQYRRQAALLKLGYHHAVILLTRPYLMQPYPHQAKKETLAFFDTYLHACCKAIKLALHFTAVLARVDANTRMFQALWYVHQVSFCCISTLHLLRRIREGQKKKLSGQALSAFNSEDAELRELADRATKTLAEDTGQYSPGPGYAIILNELKEEVLSQDIRAGGGQLWDGWTIADWLDLDSAARATLLPPRNFAALDKLYMLADTIPRTRYRGHDNTGH